MEHSRVDVAKQLCRDFLSESWTNANDDDIDCRKLSGGISNQLFCCRLKDDKLRNCTKNGEVVVRYYGSDFSKGEYKFIGDVGENTVFYMLSTLGLAPKLLGVFEGGRIEQFISGRNLKPDEISNSKISDIIANKLGHIHSLEVPISKQPVYAPKLFELLKSRYEKARETIKTPNELQSILLSFDFVEEFTWFMSKMDNVHSRVAFSHNDLNFNNMLLMSTGIDNGNDILVLDFETCTYNYRGYDVAFILSQKSFKNLDCYIKLSDIQDVDEAEKTRFIELYLNEWKSRAEVIDSVLDTVEHVKKEADIFGLLVSLGYIGYVYWSIVTTNFIPLEYGVNRLNFYKLQKEKLMTQFAELQ